MWTSIATRRALVLGRAAGPLRKTVRILPRVLFLRNGEVSAVRPLTISALMRAPAGGAKKTKSRAGTVKKKKTTMKAVKKKPAKKTKPKAKKPVKKKKVVKKAVKKPAKAKKTLTPEQKERKEISTLKKLSLLKGPDQKPPSAWTVYVAQNVRKGEGRVTTQLTELASAFKGLTTDERDDLEIAADANKAENQQIIKQWVRSYPPEAIYAANLARRRLAKKTGKTVVRVISDDRQPARSVNAYARYCKDNYSKGDGESNTDAFARLAARWKDLSDKDKAFYQDQAAADVKRSSAAFKELNKKAKIYRKELAK